MRFVALATIVAAVVTLLRAHASVINGPSFFPWPYRTIAGTPIFVSFALAVLPALAALGLERRFPRLRGVWLSLLMVSCMTMKVASSAWRGDVTGVPGASLRLIPIIVENPAATSYYTDAAGFSAFPLRTWMANFPQLMWRLNLHSASKPPGPILYWLGWIDALGANDRAATLGGLALGALATLSIPATYLMLRVLTDDPRAAFAGAAFLALCPGFVLFFPMMDPVFVALSAALIGLWFSALRRDSLIWSSAFGVVLALTTLATFNLLVIGLFLAVLPFVLPGLSGQERLRRAIKHAVIGIGCCALCEAALYAALNYDVIGTFLAAWKNQHDLLRRFADQRPYPATIPFDWIDFALGSGWISVLIAVEYFRNRTGDRSRRGLAWLALAQLVAVAALGLLQMETARVWNFMLPLLMIPVGLELARWSLAERMAALAGLTIVSAGICQNLKWIY